MAKHALKYEFKFPNNLQWIDKPNVSMEIIYSVDSKSSVNPLFLQELSELVRAQYLVPLNEAWKDLYLQWDGNFTRSMPKLAKADTKLRQKTVADMWKPLEKEFEKQLDNMKSMAKTIGERYWAQIGKEKKAIQWYQLKTAAKVSYGAAKIGTSVTTIVVSGGAAFASYIGALKSVHEIFKAAQQYRASAAEYHDKVDREVTALMSERATFGWVKSFLKDDLNEKMQKVVYKKIAEICKNIKKHNKNLDSHLSVFSAKVNQLRRSAGSASSKLNDALNALDKAYAVDKKELTKAKKSLSDLISDVEKLCRDHKLMEAASKSAQKCYKENNAFLGQADGVMKQLKKSGKWTGSQALGGLVGSALDNATLQAATTKDWPKAGVVLQHWQKILNTGLNVVGAAV